MRYQRTTHDAGISGQVPGVSVGESPTATTPPYRQECSVSSPDPAMPIRMLPEMRGGAGMTLNDSVYDRLLRERIIFLGQQVDDAIANQISAQLLLLAAEDPKRDIHLYINSPGGSVTAGMAIYDTMQLVEPDVATFALGLAASMGQFLLSAGTAGKRYALPHARILMHQPSAGVAGTASDIKIQAQQS